MNRAAWLTVMRDPTFCCRTVLCFQKMLVLNPNQLVLPAESAVQYVYFADAYAIHDVVPYALGVLGGANRSPSIPSPQTGRFSRHPRAVRVRKLN